MAVGMTSGLCIGASFGCSLVSLAIFVYSAVLLAAYTPIYRRVECISMGSSIGEQVMSMAPPLLALNGTTSLKCSNPNPYAIGVSGRDPGRVYTELGGQMKRIGYSYVQDSNYPSEGSDVGTTRLELMLPSEDLSVMEAIPMMDSPEVQVISELLVSISAAPSFYGIEMAARQDGERWCGFRIRNFGNAATRKVGPSACAKTVEELVLPPVDAESKTTYIEMDEATLNAQDAKKNGVIGGIMAATALIGLATAGCGILVLRRAGVLGKQAREVGQDATKPPVSNDDRPEATIGEKAPPAQAAQIFHLGEDTAETPQAV